MIILDIQSSNIQALKAVKDYCLPDVSDFEYLITIDNPDQLCLETKSERVAEEIESWIDEAASNLERKTNTEILSHLEFFVSTDTSVESNFPPNV